MEREILYQKIYNDLIAGIQDGRYPPGHRLPSEKELSGQYNVSRITSKKALEMLVDQNLITRMPGKGSYVLDTEKPLAEFRTTVDSALKKTPGREKRLIGVVMDYFGAAFGDQIIEGIEYECRRLNMNMILKFSYGSTEVETEAIDELINLNVQGIILMCVHEENYNSRVLRLFVDKFPIILIDREMPGMPIPCVNTDNYKAAKELIDLLINKGHKNICFLSHQFNQSSPVSARFTGYLDSVLEHGLKTSEELWIRDLNAKLPRLSDDEGEENMEVERIRKFIIEHPQVTGFFAVNQPIGIMLYKILKELHQEQEKEVVFFDGLEESYDSNPIFTRIVQGEFMMGVVAVKSLNARMDGKEVPQKNYIPYTLVKK